MISARFCGRLAQFQLDAAFTVPAEGVTGLFGPSGCGKTTLLRCLAGLLRLPGGAARMGAEIWQDGPVFVPPHRRAIGFVFQDARLFPHLSVARNLRYAQPRGGGRIGEEEVIAALDLRPLLGRDPASLSGGQRQRVAIGRALLAQPRLLLLDEPLTALDAPASRHILSCLRGMARHFALPMIYVSHRFDEIASLADRLLLMRAGRVMATECLAEDMAVSFELVIQDYEAAYDLTLCGGPGWLLRVPGRWGEAGEKIRFCLGADDVGISLTPQASSILNIFPGRIHARREAGGPYLLLNLAVSGAPCHLPSRITRKSWDELGLAVGDEVFIHIHRLGQENFPARPVLPGLAG